MVRRRLILAPRTLLALGMLAVALSALIPAAADAANRRVGISDYQWTDPAIEIDRGEHVSWYWIGPDTMHSVTGESPNARGFDSDPEENLPQHPVGHRYTATFDEPGIYELSCKLHSSVRGTVTVSNKPGDPVTEPDPVPANRVDRTAPRLGGLSLSAKSVRRKGVRLSFALDEPTKVVDAEYFRLARRGKRQFAGFQRWRKVHIGFNDVRFGQPGKHFKARPGRYVAKLRATDASQNESRARSLRFRIPGR